MSKEEIEWISDELVERFGVGVDPEAHLDAPNSLLCKPAIENAMNKI